MRILCLQHSFFDDPGAITDWAHQRNHTLSIVRTDAGEVLPNTNQFDFLIVLGGTQTLLDSNDLQTLAGELALIKQAINENKLVLGVCLGSQMIAVSQGMQMTRSPFPEIGVLPVVLTDAGKRDPLFKNLPNPFPAMHMHYDMVQLSSEARLLASSAGCPVQAYAIGDKTYGIQFHMEITNENIALRLSHMKDELESGIYITTRELLANSDLSEINQYLFVMLDAISPSTMTSYQSL